MALEQETIYGCFHYIPLFADKIFGEISPACRESLDLIKQTRNFRRNQTIIDPGGVSNIFVLKEGQAKSVFFNEINQKINSQIIQPNEIIGLCETIANLPFKLSVQTTTPCSFEIIRQKDFLHFLHKQPEVCFRLAKMLGRNLNQSFQSFYSSTF